MNKKPLAKISNREQDVMCVIWQANKDLTASEIAEHNISINTVQVALRNLIKKGYIEVANIVYSGTVLTRSYRPIVSAEEYALDKLKHINSRIINFSALNLIDNLYTASDNKAKFLDKLEEMIKTKRKQMQEDK